MTSVSDSQLRHADRASITDGAAATEPAAHLKPSRRAKPAIDPDTFLAEAFATYSETGMTVGAYAVRHPRIVLTVLRQIRRLTEVSIELPAGPETEALAAALLEYPLSRRSMLGVTSALYNR